MYKRNYVGKWFLKWIPWAVAKGTAWFQSEIKFRGFIKLLPFFRWILCLSFGHVTFGFCSKHQWCVEQTNMHFSVMVNSFYGWEERSTIRMPHKVFGQFRVSLLEKWLGTTSAGKMPIDTNKEFAHCSNHTWWLWSICYVVQYFMLCPRLWVRACYARYLRQGLIFHGGALPGNYLLPHIFSHFLCIY